jgi:hypothetical protein
MVREKGGMIRKDRTGGRTKCEEIVVEEDFQLGELRGRRDHRVRVVFRRAIEAVHVVDHPVVLN